MMGFSSMGCGIGGNSSTSNLSASAPPFTVDRLNPKPNSISNNPMLHYSDSISPYGVEPFRAEAAIDCSEMMSVPAAATDGYRFSASASVTAPSTNWSAHNSGYGGDVKPYYSPYVASLVGEDRVLGEDERSPYNVVAPPQHHDYTQSLFDVEYGPRWVDGLGFDDGKRAKRSEVDGKFSLEKMFVGGSHGYDNQMYQGGCGSENMNMFKEDSGVLYKNLHPVPDQEVYAGSSSTGYIEDKSCLEQQYGFFHYDSSKKVFSASSPPYPESYPPLVSPATEKSFPNYTNSSSPYDPFRPVDTPYQGRVSVGRSSPAVVIRPPPASSWNLEPENAFRKPAGSENAAGVNIVDYSYTFSTKPKDSALKSSSKLKDGSFEASSFKFFKQGNAPISSAPLKELSRPLNTKDTSDSKAKGTLGSQTSDVNVSSGFTMAGDGAPAVNSAEESSDFVDHHSTVDSPCWKGAPSSPFSVFDIESGNCDCVKVNLVEQYGFGHGENSGLHSIDSNRVFSEKVECNTGNENECGRNGENFGFEKSLDAICSTSEQSLLDGITTDRVWIPPARRSKGVELSGDIRKDSNLLFDMKAADTKHLFDEGNDVSEGASVAVLAAEKVLASPASQEDAIEHATISAPTPRLDVSSIVKSMDSLSQLLQFHISNDLCSLGEENTEILKHVISNLSASLSKKDVDSQATSKPESKDLSGETALGDIISRGPRAKCEASSSCTNPDFLQLHEGERDDTFPGKKDKISPVVSLSRDDFHITGDDEMAKAIKKVLEQNFEIDEDMHSQALLFKNLWLEAEAKLCSISYKARFERMKAQMEDVKLKTPKEDVDAAEMASDLCVSPDTVIMSVLAPKARVDAPNVSTSGGNADLIESPVLARFNILNSREVSSNPVITEKQQGPEIVDSSVMARFGILKSREENPKPISTEEQRHPEMAADGKHADFIMARFNILKSREESSKVVGADKEKPSEALGDEFAGEKYFRPLVRGQLEDEGGGGLVEGGKFDSYFERAGYESPVEYSGGSATNEAAVHQLRSGSGAIGDSSSSSEWEHVLKEDFSWKN